METNNEYNLVPGFGNSFGTGWRVMADNFLRLLLVIVILAILVAPFKIFNMHFGSIAFFRCPHGTGTGMMRKTGNIFSDWHHSEYLQHFLLMVAMLYAFLVAPVFKYGGDIIFVRAVRKIKPDFEYLVKGFMENYLHIVHCKPAGICPGYSRNVCPYSTWNNYCMQACVCILYSNGQKA